MPALYFGFNFPPLVERHSSETNKNKDKEQEEQHPDPDQLASVDLVSQEEDRGNNGNTGQSVLFAGWASFVLGSPGNATIHGVFSPAEQLVVDTLNTLPTTTSGAIKLFGWEALQGLLTPSGDVIGVEVPLSTKTFYSGTRDVAAGGPSCDHYTVVVDDTGHLFFWTASEPTPKALSLSSLGVTFERVWAGEGHFLALAVNGSLYSWGSGRHGQLGHGNLKSETRPKCIEALEGIRIADAACGGSFSVALSEFGDVYTFGLNDHGQLGIGDRHKSSGSSGSSEHHGRNNAYPQLVDFYRTNEDQGTPLDVSVVKVACGQAHAVCLDDQGNAWSCGWGKYRQLEPQESSHRSQSSATGTLTKHDDWYSFRKVAAKGGSIYHWRNVTCGRWSTFLWD